MKVLSVQQITAIIECDCTAQLTCKRFEWKRTCFKCGKAIQVMELVEIYMYDKDPRLGRPVGAKDIKPRKLRVDRFTALHRTIQAPNESAKDKAERVIAKFKLKYPDLNKIAKIAEDLTHGRRRGKRNP